MNSVCLLGRLTADPEMRQTPNGTAVCSFSVAVNRNFKNRNGEYQADFINCVAWRQTAEFITRYFKKGNMIGLSGSIQTRQYQDKDTGKNRTAFEVLINNAYFTGGRREAEKQRSTLSTARLDFVPLAPDEGDLPF